MKVIESIIKGVKVIEPEVHEDQRCYFLETFQAKRYRDMLNLDIVFVQDTLSRSTYGVLRGLHYQQNHPQGKLIQVLRGEIFDVAVDLRKESSSYGSWVGEILSDNNSSQLYIPPGFAHGYTVLSDDAIVIYKNILFTTLLLMSLLNTKLCNLLEICKIITIVTIAILYAILDTSLNGIYKIYYQLIIL